MIFRMREPGYYRDGPRPGGRIRYWDGESWGRFYWTISRKLCTFAVASVMVLGLAAGVPLMMSEPSGRTAEARTGDAQARERGLALIGGPSVLGALLLIGMHRRLLLQDDSPEVQ